MRTGKKRSLVESAREEYILSYKSIRRILAPSLPTLFLLKACETEILTLRIFPR